MVTTSYCRVLILFALIFLCTTGCDSADEFASEGGESTETCEYNGENYNVGDGFPAADGCNSCSCDDSGEISCTLMACLEGCFVDGTQIEVGDSVPSGDGCNDCLCEDDGSLSCTEMACPAPGCANKDCGDVCNPCEASDEDCAVLAVEYVCNQAGECTASAPNCEEIDPCEDKSCGEACFPNSGSASSGDSFAPEPASYCNLDGACEQVFPECEDLCADVVCPTSDSYCEDSVAYGATYSECNPATGECDIAPGLAPQDCGEEDMVCVDGECVEDLCAGFIPPCTEDSECPGNMICSFEGCNSSSASCDPETGDIIATGDCGGGACVELAEECPEEECGEMPQYEAPECPGDAIPDVLCQANDDGVCKWTLQPCPDLCADFIPPCDTDEGCPGDMVCYKNKDTCYSSGASCDPETGDILMTADCGGGLCIEADNVCADFIPPCNTSDECPGDMECVFEGCNPSSAFCDPITGDMGFTDDCGGGVCVPTSNPCDDLNCEFGCDDGECLSDPCELIDIACPEGTVCYGGECTETCEPGEWVEAGDGCNSCECPESGIASKATACTEIACGPTECSKDGDCGEGQFCDFPNDDCGVWGGVGECVTPQDCAILGGPGFCGCDGSFQLTDCDLHSKGTDVFQYGGCMGEEPVAKFKCGYTECNMEGEYCSISMNDIAGEAEPEYYNSCQPLPEGCAQGDCSCVQETDFGECYDATGYTMTFYPGG